MKVLFPMLGAMLLSAGCQQAPDPAVADLVSQAQALRDEVESMVAIDTQEYTLDYTSETNLTVRVSAFYQRFQNNSVYHDTIIQYPWNAIDNRPDEIFLRGIWQNSRMLRAEICRRQDAGIPPRCERLEGQNAVRQLQEIFSQLEPQVREMFDARQPTVPRQSPPGVTQT